MTGNRRPKTHIHKMEWSLVIFITRWHWHKKSFFKYLWLPKNAQNDETYLKLKAEYWNKKMPKYSYILSDFFIRLTWDILCHCSWNEFGYFEDKYKHYVDTTTKTQACKKPICIRLLQYLCQRKASITDKGSTSFL